jgi:hypothetical protein
MFHLVLAAAATDAAVACGGSVAGPISNDTSGNGPRPGPGPGSDPVNPQPQPLPPPPEPEPDAGRKDAGYHDASVPDSSIPDAMPDVVVPACVTGQFDPNPAWCCAVGDPACVGGGGGDKCDLDCKAVCTSAGSNDGIVSCYWTTKPNGDPAIGYFCGACGVGRIPDGTPLCDRGDSIGARLAMQAYYEAASVTAFERLADALAREGAPSSLVRRARRAARDEERHARLFARLAAARGVEVAWPANDDARPSLEELASENAREGCVRETYGALLALRQSVHAADPELRRAFAEVAEDEITHAAFSWDLARFFEELLGTSHAHERARAVADLRAAGAREHDAIARALGLPEPAEAAALWDDLFARIAA